MRNKFRLAAAGVAVVCAVPACAPGIHRDWSKNADVAARVNRTGNLASVDLGQLNNSILRQIGAARIPLPGAVDLFPEDRGLLERMTAKIGAILFDHTNELTEGYAGAKIKNGHTIYTVKGIADGDQIVDGLIALMQQGLYDDGYSCADNVVAQDYRAFRAFAALHEMGHYLSIQLKTLERVYFSATGKNTVNDRSDEQFLLGAGERLADVTTALYIMSNYTDGVPYVRKIEDLRTAIADYSHPTASSLAIARQAYKLNPRRGITIVEAALWAGDLVAAQPNIRQEPEDIFKTGAIVEYGNIFHYSDSKTLGMVRKAKDARARFCNPSAYRQIQPGD